MARRYRRRYSEKEAMSREIDAQLAEKLGPPWDETRCRICGWPLAETAVLGCVAGNCSQRGRGGLRCDDPPRYSTDPAASKKLLDRMAELWWYVRIESTPAGKHACCVWLNGKVFIGRSDAREMAVALAAGRALGVEMKGKA